MVKRKGIKIDIIEETAEGDISIPHLEQLITGDAGRVALIAITHIPTNSGKPELRPLIHASITLTSLLNDLYSCKSLGTLLSADASSVLQNHSCAHVRGG